MEQQTSMYNWLFGKRPRSSPHKKIAFRGTSQHGSSPLTCAWFSTLWCMPNKNWDISPHLVVAERAFFFCLRVQDLGSAHVTIFGAATQAFFYMSTSVFSL